MMKALVAYAIAPAPVLCPPRNVRPVLAINSPVVT